MNATLESFWAEILSKDPAKIITAFHSISEEEQEAVIEHLQRMADENGWSEGQRRNSRTALHVLLRDI